MLSADSFDLSNGVVVLRLVCVFFFLPHMYFKAIGNPPPASKTFNKAGYPNPLFFFRLALLLEILIVLALLFDFYTQYTALVLAAFLLVAAITLFLLMEKSGCGCGRKAALNIRCFGAWCVLRYRCCLGNNAWVKFHATLNWLNRPVGEH